MIKNIILSFSLILNLVLGVLFGALYFSEDLHAYANELDAKALSKEVGR